MHFYSTPKEIRRTIWLDDLALLLDKKMLGHFCFNYIVLDSKQEKDFSENDKIKIEIYSSDFDVLWYKENYTQKFQIRMSSNLNKNRTHWSITSGKKKLEHVCTGLENSADMILNFIIENKLDNDSNN